MLLTYADVAVVVDSDGDGLFDERRQFATGFRYADSILPYASLPEIDADVSLEVDRLSGHAGLMIEGLSAKLLLADGIAAIEEFDQQFERKTYLDAQHADLDEALATWFEGATYSRVTQEITFGEIPAARLLIAQDLLAANSSHSEEPEESEEWGATAADHNGPNRFRKYRTA